MRKYVVFLIILIVSLMLFYESRHFYKIGDRTLTVWKTNNGCFVIPYSYYETSAKPSFIEKFPFSCV